MIEHEDPIEAIIRRNRVPDAIRKLKLETPAILARMERELGPAKPGEHFSIPRVMFEGRCPDCGNEFGAPVGCPTCYPIAYEKAPAPPEGSAGA